MDKKIFEEVTELIAKVLGVDRDKIDEETAIGDIESWDSLHHLRIVLEIEQKYGFRFTPDVMMDLEDVSDIVSAVEEHVK